VGITIALNSLGWNSQNILFGVIDTQLGQPLLASENPSQALASITGSTITVGGDLVVRADNAAQLNATLSNAAISEAVALFDANGKGVGGMLASNKVSSGAQAWVASSVVVATGAVTVDAVARTGIFANILVVTSARLGRSTHRAASAAARPASST